ncbi:uncharacterized protein Z519_12298 [Cladophialophora bantiana CBS 173.52]|uniref:Beta-lactamase-related domain-containing protein n=1 Tax=Cladophialophora bantiana (strain ATCC 10958 / CBS 173.52 / CDC B-1940 / NIH 8579) TaxID=1442370 RepID=A0A0D2FKG5_CLAB1|nr:uncharacterized protein Z519_12298 [Cladophialophora bantiana CBS 173.52]KIW87187.1 hypothetical protein Z519_12298 [Cladophialophora bantiana CBS 173.52]
MSTLDYQLSADGETALHKRLIDAVADPVKGIPGAVVCVVNKSGKLIFSEAQGKIGSQSPEPMELATIFWLASCSKLILSIACMQLVERGLLNLDDPDQVELLCPRLKAVQILKQDSNGELGFVSKNNRITLRMLLTHTAGFNYAPYCPPLRDWILSHSRNFVDFDQPLITEPGEDWHYGFNNEWVSLMVELASGQRMEDYLRNNIFEPLGLENATLFPNEVMQQKLAKMNHRSSTDGSLKEGHHFMQSILDIANEDDKSSAFQNAAGGIFSRPVEYCEIIATLLNGGLSPTTNARILRSSTVDIMFLNQIPQFPDFARKGIPSALPEDTNPIPELYPSQPHHQPQGWGLSFMLTLEPTPQGRGPFSASWAGMANCYWWADRHKGVGGFVGTQIVPFADHKVIDLVSDVESLVYSYQRQEAKE